LSLFTQLPRAVLLESGLPPNFILVNQGFRILHLRESAQSPHRRSGEGRIRTSDAGLGGVAVFEAAAFNHSLPPLQRRR
jgi:hypothetical protein